MLARLRSGFSLDSEYLRVQDRFRPEDGTFLLLEQQELSRGSSQHAESSRQNIVDNAAQEALQREYAELISWNNTNIDPQLLERDQQQQQQQQDRQGQMP